MNFAELLNKAATTWPRRVALIQGDLEIDFLELRQRAARFAAAVRDQGAGPGDRIAMIMPNCVEFAEAFFGAAAVPCTLVPIDANLKATEVADIVRDVMPRLVTAAPAASTLFAEVEPLVASVTRPLAYEKLLRAVPATEREFGVPEIDPNATAMVLYTSGTVGGSKGVMLSYDNLGYSPDALLEWLPGLADNFIGGLAVPISHIAGPLFCTCVVLCGGTLVIMERFAPQRFLAECERTGVTFTALVPPMIQAVLQVREWQKYPLTKMRYGCSFGAMASQEVLNNFAARYPNFAVATGYGLTETGPLLTLAPVDAPAEKFGALGKTIKLAEVRIRDTDGTDLPAEATGEIVARGPMLMQGYWGRPDTTAEVVRDGWFYTGDVGKFDKDGYLWIQGRIKDIINVAGLKVFAPEVEDVLYAHPAVEEVAVIAETGGLKGEAVKAVVKLKEAASVTKQALIDHCRGRLAEYKVPRHIELRDQPLPRSRTGKINKEALKAAPT